MYVGGVGSFLLNRGVERRPHNVLDRRAHGVILEILHGVDNRGEDRRAHLEILERVNVLDQRAHQGVDIVNRPRTRHNEVAIEALASRRASRRILRVHTDKIGEIIHRIKLEDIIVASTIVASEEQSKKAH